MYQGAPGVSSLTGKVIHKIIGMAVYIGVGFEYSRDRIRMVLHITSFRGAWENIYLLKYLNK
jgi:hypothetical protein